jgi:tight adherence protein C
VFDTIKDQLGNADLSGWTGFAVIAGAIGVTCFVVLKVFAPPTVPADTATPGASDSDIDLMKLSSRLRVEQTGRDEEQIAPELRRAGYYDPKALARFQLVRTVLMLLPLFVTAFFVVAAGEERRLQILLYGAVAILLGFSIPRVYISIVARARRRQIERGLPVALDLASLALLGGQNIQAAFQRSAEATRPTFPVLAEEMELVLRQAELKTFPMALEQWADRSAVPEVQNVSVAISQADRLGVNVADALMELSTNFRTGMRQRADATANRAAVWMLFPTILCLWIPSALVLSAPLFFEFQDRRAKVRESMQNRTGDSGDLPDSFGKYLKRDDNLKNRPKLAAPGEPGL